MKPNYVPGTGKPKAKLMIIGEAPGKNENEQKLPFVGVTGKDVNEFLIEAGSSRGDCYLTNVVKYQPPFNNFTRLDEIGVDLTESRLALWEEINRIQPNCILALGEQALQAVTGKAGITQWRGSCILALDGKTKVVSSYHPAYLYKHSDDDSTQQVAYAWKYIIQFDFNRAVIQSKFSEYNPPNRAITIARDSGTLYRWISDNYDKDSAPAVDIEVVNCIPITVSICFNPAEAVAIPLFSRIGEFRIPGVGDSELVPMWRDIQEVFQHPLGVIGHNFKYDQDKMVRLGFRFRKLYGDTMLQAHVRCAEFPRKKLEFLTSVDTYEPYYKEEGKEFNYRRNRIEQLLNYNGKDACVTKEIHNVGEVELKEDGERYGFDLLNDFYFDFVTKLHSFYSRLENNGFRQDLKVKRELLDKYMEMWKRRQALLEKRIGCEVNCSSPQQISQLLYEKMGLPKRKGRGRTYNSDDPDEQGATGEAILTSLMQHAKCDDSKKQVIQDILDVRKIKKTISTYILPHADYDGYIKTSCNIIGTPARTSTNVIKGKPVRPTKMGLAFQTLTKHGEIGKDIRKQFICDDGWCFIEIDSSQAEDRVVTLLCKDFEGLKNYETIDKHWEVASWIFDDVEESWTYKAYKGSDKPDKNDGRRFIGKKARHASNYDMGAEEGASQLNKEAQKLGLTLRLSKWKMQTILEIVHERKPEIRATYHKEIREAINKDRTLISPHGRPHQYIDRMSEQLYKAAYSFIPQATVSDNIKKAGIASQARFDVLGISVKFLIEAHDALIVTCPIETKDEVGKILKEEMERSINFKICTLSRNYDLVIPAEAEIGFTNLLEMEKFKIA